MSFLKYIYVLIEFTIKIFLIIFDSLISCGIFLFSFFFIYDYDYYFLSTFLRILIPIAFITKLLYWFILRNKKIDLTKSVITERFVAIILTYIVPIYILWNTPTLYINKEISDIIYILMSLFFIVGISIEKRLFFRKKEAK